MTALSDPGREFTDLLAEVSRVHGLLLAAGDGLAGPAGLTGARWQVLAVVDHGPRTIADVARAMGLTRQAVRQTATGLVRAGLAEFRDNVRDRRARLLAPTPRGRTALREVELRQAEWANDLAARLPATGLRAVTGTLRHLGEVLQGR
ncbi:MarR family transcriptional regulator [Actinosynnema sp. NPDC002837]